MEKITKGDFGYLEKQAQRELGKTLILFMASFGVLLIGILIAGTKNNLLTIVAVLGLLPAAKELTTSIIFSKAKKYNCPKTLYDEVQNLLEHDNGDNNGSGQTDKTYKTDETDESLLVIYDLYMTSQEKNYPIYSMCCRNKTLIGIAGSETFDYKKAEEHIQIMLRQNGFKNITVKIFAEQEKYIGRMKELKEQKTENREAEQAVLRLMLNLSL